MVYFVISNVIKYDKQNNTLRSLLEKEKLNGTNFLDWFLNLRMVLKQERKEFTIKESFLFENYSQISEPVKEICPIQLLLLKE